MTRPRMPLGNDIFEKLRQDGSYYIDKTGLISELVNDKNNTVTLFTRPRRFGKTLNMSMLDCFFDISRDSRGVFEGLAVSEDKVLCAEYMNQYPTVFFSFKEIRGLTFKSAYAKLCDMFSMFCSGHVFLLEKVLETAEREKFERIKSKIAPQEEIESFIFFISKLLHDYYNKPVIILIDEYDVPASYANENGYYREMIDLIRSMFSVALKTNPYLKFAVITGCLRITKESIFTGTNNFKSYSLSNTAFSRYFGFTEPEVQRLLADCQMSKLSDNIKEWYDGYIFGSTEDYCPWDVLNYVSDLFDNPKTTPKNYWRNTSHNGIIRQFVERTDYDVTDRFETLLNGGTIEQRVVEELTYDEVFSKEENLWSMLYMTGYLTKAKKDERGNILTLRIPNKEVAGIFEDTVVSWFEDNIDRSKQAELMQAFWNGNEEQVSKLVTDFLWQTISYHDYHENYYHAFLLGIFMGIGYAQESNNEYGLGRPDIVIKDKAHRRIMILETKFAKSKEGLPKKCDEALDQIERDEYCKGVPDGYESIMCYGVAFWKKRCMVKLYKGSYDENNDR